MSNIARWRTFQTEELRKIVSESYSLREVARKLGYSQDSGSVVKSIRVMVKELNLDISHFKGQGWNKENYDYESFLINSNKKNGITTLNPLVKLKGRKCESCGLEEWMGLPINLEIHHINGNRKDNRLENLQLLCPNCHSYTDNWRGRGSKRNKSKSEHLDSESAK